MRKYRKPTDDRTEIDTFYSPVDFMDEAFWESNFPRFTAIARRRIATLPWYRKFGGRASGGMEPDDYVLTAAELLMSGRRRCRTQYSREACVHGILDSLISHHSEDPENAFAHDSISVEDDENRIHQPLADPDPAIDDALVLEGKLEEFTAGFADERQRRYIDLIVSGECDSAADAAAALGVPESEIRNMVKVVRRRRAQWPGTPRRRNA